ncbi:MAG TPA: hypothetical protein VF081_09275 [Solirubrobacterales bacterium]
MGKLLRRLPAAIRYRLPDRLKDLITSQAQRELSPLNRFKLLSRRYGWTSYQRPEPKPMSIRTLPNRG